MGLQNSDRNILNCIIQKRLNKRPSFKKWKKAFHVYRCSGEPNGMQWGFNFFTWPPSSSDFTLCNIFCKVTTKTLFINQHCQKYIKNLMNDPFSIKGCWQCKTGKWMEQTWLIIKCYPVIRDSCFEYLWIKKCTFFHISLIIRALLSMGQTSSRKKGFKKIFIHGNNFKWKVLLNKVKISIIFYWCESVPLVIRPRLL